MARSSRRHFTGCETFSNGFHPLGQLHFFALLVFARLFFIPTWPSERRGRMWRDDQRKDLRSRRGSWTVLLYSN
jgi:hypothetical protein